MVTCQTESIFSINILLVLKEKKNEKKEGKRKKREVWKEKRFKTYYF